MVKGSRAISTTTPISGSADLIAEIARHTRLSLTGHLFRHHLSGQDQYGKNSNCRNAKLIGIFCFLAENIKVDAVNAGQGINGSITFWPSYKDRPDQVIWLNAVFRQKRLAEHMHSATPQPRNGKTGHKMILFSHDNYINVAMVSCKLYYLIRIKIDTRKS